MNFLALEQQRRNRQSRDAWDLFANHRRHVTQILVQAASAASQRVCILGSGNCNDLELPLLAQTFHEVHLVDLDQESLHAGIVRQCPAPVPQIQAHPGIDVTHALALLAAATSTPPAASALDAWFAELAQTPDLGLPGPFEVVASCCLLSQLLETVIQSLGEGHPRFLEALVAVRLQHARLLLELTRPGGLVLLITDFVSSVTAPELTCVSDEALPGLATRWIQERNFFSGLNPFVLHQQLWQTPACASDVADATLLRPWRWDLGPRSYAVTAIQVRKQAGGGRSEAGGRKREAGAAGQEKMKE